MVSRDEMVRTLSTEYPTLREELGDEACVGLTTLEIACLTRHAQAQIDAGNHAELKRCFETARKFLLDGDTDVRAAVRVSFLEDLYFHDGRKRRSWARSLVPEPLASFIAE